MEKLNYRLVRDALGFYTQVPLEEPVVSSPVEENEEDTDDLAALEGTQVLGKAPRRRGRSRKGDEQ